MRSEREEHEYQVLRRNLVVIGDELAPRGIELLAGLLIKRFLAQSGKMKGGQSDEQPMNVEPTQPSERENNEEAA